MTIPRVARDCAGEPDPWMQAAAAQFWAFRHTPTVIVARTRRPPSTQETAYHPSSTTGGDEA